MLKVSITYEDDAITVTSTDMETGEYNIERYHDVSNYYDMCECLKDFIRLHIEQRGD